MYNSSLIDEYGKPLVPLDDDKLNGVKPLRIQDQIATDENGRRRFHGAFTGGFSAGYWNTVGSQEGWKPQHFKSSRNIKAAPLGQKPLDFMDDEDLEEFGNAPLSLQNRDDDPTIITVDEINLKRVLNLDESKIMAATAPEREAKKAEKEQRRAAAYNKRKLYVLEKYGCDTGSASNVWHSVTEEDISAAFEPTNTTEPEAETPALNDLVATDEVTLKFGFGDYTPLSTEEPANVQPIVKKAAEVPTKKPNTLSIRGHAFGVGALEEDDDDIYAREDMSRYDFSLEDKRKKKQRVIKMLVQDEEAVVAKENDDKKAEEEETSNDGEKTKTADKDELVIKTTYQIYKEEVGKPNFLKPRVAGERKSRFGPAPKETENRQKSEDSANVLTEQPQVAETSLTTTKINPFKQNNTAQEKSRSSYEEDKKQKLLELISAKSSNFVRTGEVINTSDDSLTKEKEIESKDSKDVNKKIDFPAAISSFKPFAYDELKQMRYDQFVKANVCSEKEISEFLATIQPNHMSQWDREMEMKEFIQSRKLYRPLDGIMANRFVTETTPGSTVAKIEPIATAAPKEETEKAKEKIVTIVRTSTSWRPSAQLCKRFNIPEPLTELVADKKSKLMKKPQLSVFDYLEGSVHKKSDFVTPVIIPKHNPNPKEIIKSALDARNQSEKTEKRDENEQTPAKRPSRWNIEHRDEIQKTKSQDKNQIVPTESAPGTSVPGRLTYVPKAARGVDKEPTPVATEKRELFQAIFSDNEDDEEDKQQKSSEITATANKSEALNLPPRLSTQTDAASANLLRNLSPPRGIFAALFSAGEKETKEEEEEGKTSNDYEPLRKVLRLAENKSEENPPDNSYGPAIPKSLAPKAGAADAIATSKNIIEQTPAEQRISIRGVEIIEKWVEKDDASDSDDDSDSSSDSSIERSHQSKHKSSKKSKKAKKSKKKSKKKERAKHKSAKRKKH